LNLLTLHIISFLSARHCQKNEAAYPTLKLNHLFDLYSVVDYKKVERVSD